MSEKLFQKMISQAKDDISNEIAVLDASGVVIASSEPRKIGTLDFQAMEYLSNPESIHLDSAYKKVIDDSGIFKNLVSVSSLNEQSKQIAAMFAISIANVSELYDNKYDINTFIKNVILDNILPGDIFIKSNELKFEIKSSKVVYLIRQHTSGDNKVAEAVSEYLGENENNFLININERDIAIVSDIDQNATTSDIYKIGEEIFEFVQKSVQTKITIGHGSIYGSLEEISKSFKEAQIAIEVGEVFDAERNIIGFESLGVGRLIYQLPTTLCKMFLGEVFKRGSIDTLDEETLSTIKAFFDNNLNVSETSRKLFVHRNTLVYRLEKIRKITGLDLREFDHAIVFKVALMVRKYLEARDNEKILF